MVVYRNVLKRISLYGNLSSWRNILKDLILRYNTINVTEMTYLNCSVSLPYRCGTGKKFIQQTKIRISNMLLNEYDHNFSSEIVCSMSFIANKTSIIKSSQKNKERENV